MFRASKASSTLLKGRRAGVPRVSKRRVAATVAVAATAISATTATPGEAVKMGDYPTWGFLWMSKQKNYAGTIGVTASTCTTPINDAMYWAWNGIKTSTTGTAEMSRWANGAQLTTYYCNGTFSAGIDYKLWFDPNQANFLQPNGSYIGGRILHSAADSAFCAYWGVSHPCGHRDTTQINLTKFNNGSSNYRKELLLHEAGHAFDLQDVCQGGSAMSNAISSNCPWGGALMQYTAYDRTDINSQYPWK